jgi:hypothetical protein
MGGGKGPGRILAGEMLGIELVAAVRTFVLLTRDGRRRCSSSRWAVW